MPYKVKGQCIYHKDTNKKVGCTKGSVKKYLAALHANADESVQVEKEPINETKKPKIFSSTIYRLPTEDELKDINDFDLSAKEIYNGFWYTIVGRGMESISTKHKITKAIKMLCDLYPHNKEYKEALKLSKKSDQSYINENAKDLIKRLVKENLGLFLKDASSDANLFDILSDNDIIGTMAIGKADKHFGKDAVQLLGIKFNRGINHLLAGEETIVKLFEMLPDMNRIILEPEPKAIDFWFKLDAVRHSEKYMMILRGH